MTFNESKNSQYDKYKRKIVTHAIKVHVFIKNYKRATLNWLLFQKDNNIGIQHILIYN